MSLKSMVASHKLLLAMAEILEDEIFFFFQPAFLDQLFNVCRSTCPCVFLNHGKWVDVNTLLFAILQGNPSMASDILFLKCSAKSWYLKPTYSK